MRGFSLISIVVAIGLVGILASILSNMMSSNRKMMNKMKQDSEKEQLKLIFLKKFPCYKSSCKEMSQQLNEQRVGRWKFKTSCDKSRGMKVLTRRYQANKDAPSLDPLTKRVNQWKPLYELDDGYICQPLAGQEKPLEKQDFMQKANELCPAGKKFVGINSKDFSIVCR